MKLKSLDIEPIQKPVMVVNILKEFTDVMLPELSKSLHSQRGVDHRIELELGVKPSARPSYHMAPLELVELRK